MALIQTDISPNWAYATKGHITCGNKICKHILSAPEIIFINQTYYMFNYKVSTNIQNGYWNNQRQHMGVFTNEVIILGGNGFGKDDGGRGCWVKDAVTFLI